MNLASWFKQTAYVASFVSVDSYGTATYSVKRPILCRVQQERRATRRASGEEATTTHVLYTDQPVALTDRVWFPGVDPATADPRSPLAVHVSSDKGQAYSLYRVEFG